MIKLKNNNIRLDLNKLIYKRNKTVKLMQVLYNAYHCDYNELDKLPLKIQNELQFQYNGQTIPLKNIFAIHTDSGTVEQYRIDYNRVSESQTIKELEIQEEELIENDIEAYRDDYIKSANSYFITQLKKIQKPIEDIFNIYVKYINDRDSDDYDFDSDEGNAIIELSQSIVSEIASNTWDTDYTLYDDKHDLLTIMYKDLIIELIDIDCNISKLTDKHKIQISFLDYEPYTRPLSLKKYTITKSNDGGFTDVINYNEYNLED
jgi:hypothetical protein